VETIGFYEWSRTRGSPAAGTVTIAADPLHGYGNTLQVNQTDSEGNDRSAALAAVDEDDVIIIVRGRWQQRLKVGLPVDSGAFYSFPVTIGLEFEEPADEADIYVVNIEPSEWPDVVELAQVLNVENVTDWQDTLDRVMASAIDKVKSDVGNWDELNDVPTTRHAQAALRMGELMSQRPGQPPAVLSHDPAYAAAMSGKRRRFGIA
jgi:hypothetical protein